MQNLKSGKYFGNRRTVYVLRVIEYQHRGMPHVHIVIKLSDMPNDIEGKIRFINEYITAKAPPVPTDSTHPDDRRYYCYCNSHVKHGCSTAVNGCKSTASSACRRGYDGTKIGPTYFDDRGFPVYERVSQDCLKIVPHNKLILLDWNGHVNVEFSAGVKCIIYLYKYLFKGSKKSTFNLESSNDNINGRNRDEISLYLKGRFLCSMDAMWR